jgi:hypothetical protein
MRRGLRIGSVAGAVLAAVVALGSMAMAGDAASTGGDRPGIRLAAGRASAVGTADRTGAARSGRAGPVPVGAGHATGGASAAPSRTPAVAGTRPVQPYAATLPPVTLVVNAACSGGTGTWTVRWDLLAITDRMTLTAATDPLNGVAAAVDTAGPVLPGYRMRATTLLPGNASTAALSATVTRRDGTSVSVSRSVDLGTACVTQAPGSCSGPGGGQLQADFTASAERATVVYTGPCALYQTSFDILMPQPQGGGIEYSAGLDPIVPGTYREIVVGDLPPCQWTTRVAGVDHTGGSGLCDDFTATATPTCGHNFTVTMAQGADAVLPVLFVIDTLQANGEPTSYWLIQPGHSVTLAVSSLNDGVSVDVGGFSAAVGRWTESRRPRCAEAPPPPGLPGPVTASPSRLG